jgi:hypothetical protein
LDRFFLFLLTLQPGILGQLGLDRLFFFIHLRLELPLNQRSNLPCNRLELDRLLFIPARGITGKRSGRH